MREIVVSLVCFLVLAPRAVSALELGAAEARSALYEPLDARIALHDVRAGDAGEIKVTLGSRSQFEIAGVARPYHLTRIEFTVVEQGDGPAYIQLRTYDPIIEPSLTFLINVDWPRGHAIQGYNLPLAPPARDVAAALTNRRTAPEVEPEAVAAASGSPPPTPGRTTGAAAVPDSPPPAPTHAAGAVTASDPASPAPSRTADVAVPGSPPPASTRVADGDTYGPVRAHDTLWALASRFRPDDSISVQRMMLAFVEANPQGFDLRNVNGLNAGVILRIPTRDEIGLDDRAAVAEVRRQNLAWKQHRENLRAAPARAAPAPAAPVPAAPSAVPTPPAPAPAPSPPDTGTQPGGRLEVVTPGTSPDTAVLEEDTDIPALRNELALAMEAADAKRLENEEITSRLVEAEQRIEELYRLVKLKDDEIAALQAKLRAAAEAAPAPARAPPEAEPLPIPAPAAPEREPVPDMVSPETEKSIIDTIIDMLPFSRNALAVNPVFLVGAAGLLLMLLGAAVLLRRRRASAGEGDALDSPAAPSANEAASPMEQARSSAVSDASPDIGDSVQRNLQAAAPAVATRTDRDAASPGGAPGDVVPPPSRLAAYAAPVAGMEMIDAPRSEPGGPAAGQTPGLPDEIGAGRGRIAEAHTKARVGAGDDTSGVTIGPDDPTGDDSTVAIPDSAVKTRDDEAGDDFDFSIGGLTDSAARAEANLIRPVDEASGDFGPDRLEGPAADSRASAGEPAAAGDLLDPDAGILDVGPERRTPSVAPGDDEPVDSSDGTADEDAGGGAGTPGTAKADTDRTSIPVADGGGDPDPGAGAGDSGGSMDTLPMPLDDSVDEGETGMFAPDGSGGDIVQTKIDLAQVYVEMGDAENARLFLDEALAEGSADQRETARAMLSKLA